VLLILFVGKLGGDFFVLMFMFQLNLSGFKSTFVIFLINASSTIIVMYIVTVLELILWQIWSIFFNWW